MAEFTGMLLRTFTKLSQVLTGCRHHVGAIDGASLRVHAFIRVA